jgi:hypothetical protein
MSHKWRKLCLVVLFFTRAVFPAQNGGANSAVPAALPNDPAQFLALADKVNGLATEEAGPWHVKAAFQLIDEQGKVQESGTYEAFWKSATRHKVNYSSPSYSRTIWANDSGDFSTSNPKWPGDLEWMIRRSLFDLVPEIHDPQNWKLSWRDASIGINVRCIDMVPIYIRVRFHEIPVYCFAATAPVLRYGSETHQRYQGVFNNIVSLGGSYVARDVQLMREQKPFFRLHLDIIEPLQNANDAIFQPDAGAIPVPRRVVLDTDLRYVEATYATEISRSMPWAASNPLGPRNPDSAVSNVLTVNGHDVIIQVLVNKKGKVVDARAVKGDPAGEFRALPAARRWEFKPYLVQGEPVEFYTELEFEN